MRLLKAVMPDNFNIFNYGDTHEGNAMASESGMETLANRLNTSVDGLPVTCNVAIDSGDHIEGTDISHPYYDPKTCTEPQPLEQNKMAIKAREPFKEYLKVLLDGNHPLRYEKFGNLTALAADELKCHYGTWSCKISWVTKDNSLMFKSFHIHGTKQITSVADDPQRRNANMKLSLKKQLMRKHGDCLLMTKGHTHKLIVCLPEPELFLADDGVEINHQYTRVGDATSSGYIHPDNRFYINTGSMLKLYANMDEAAAFKIHSGYAERAEYDPVELGFTITKVRDRKITGIEKVLC
ncbi:hypothetical protein LCGC14_1132370 [marine sediment metagenome]|uniref:Calcineurin-like phosphoesterase domain-containing protein n=1 Tax=marine sediment metagenome TaxID=412755 RepID=A0A0F9PIY5_9ZZZZ